MIVAFALLSVALVAIFEWEAHAAGWLGVLGLCVAIVGTLVMAGDWWSEAFAVPWIAEDAPALIEGGVGLMSFALFGIGWILFGVASLRAGVFPAAISIGIIAGGLVSALPILGAYLYGHVVLGLTLVTLGVWMTRTSAAARLREPSVAGA